MSTRTVKVYLVAAGDYHDIDFARLELLKLLAENEKIRVSVAQDYHDIDAIGRSDFLVTYTCNLVPTEAEQQALRAYVAGGKRWFALHGTNSILKFLADGRVDSPEIAPVLMQTLGTQFIAHPPIQPFKVRVADPQHELVEGIGEFETDDELYLCRVHGKLHLLLDTRYTGAARGFVEEQWPDDVARPVYYINKVGNGEVLYLNLGHCRGHYDMQPMMAHYPKIERGSWQLPQFYELLRRGIGYCSRGAA
ncbi:MAG TPA: ThuA domain-containing protein [Pseudomonadales bacterium]